VSRRAPPTSASLLPRQDARDVGLFLVVAVIAFLAALAGLGARASTAAAASWAAGLDREITVRLRGASASDAGVNLALATLRTEPGVVEARAISREEAEALLAPWLGTGGIPQDIALPRLLAVTVDPGRAAELGVRIDTLLVGAGLNVVVDAHASWATEVRASLSAVRWVAFGALALLVVAGIAVIASATHAGLLARRDVVEALHLVGATDGFIAGEFQRRFGGLGLQAGAAGALLAGMTVAFLLFSTRATPDQAWLLPQLTLSPWDIGLLAATPLVTGLVARLAARATVLRSLAEML
jgi:cell division transport system permease protein